jgi:uncharacterized membrane protein (UPF0127 family)
MEMARFSRSAASSLIGHRHDVATWTAVPTLRENPAFRGAFPVKTPSLLPLLLCLVLAACPKAPAEPVVKLAGQSFRVEIADDDAERSRGLMFRDRMDADRGMLFVFDDSAPRSFWMLNTRIPLDILYFDAQRRLVSLHSRVPPCGDARPCPTYPSRKAARYVLELNAGVAEQLGVRPGDSFSLTASGD